MRTRSESTRTISRAPAIPGRSIGPVGYAKDPRVDDYLAALPAWQQKICAQVRDLVHEVDPAVEETVKRIAKPNRVHSWVIDIADLAAVEAATREEVRMNCRRDRDEGELGESICIDDFRFVVS